MDTPLGRWVNGQSDAIELSKMDPKHIMIFSKFPHSSLDPRLRTLTFPPGVRFPVVMLRVLKRDVEQRVTWFRTFRPPLIPLVQGWSVLEQLDLLKELDLCGLGKEPDVALLLDNIGHKMMGAAWTEHKLDKVSSSDGASSGDVATTQAATQALERVQKTNGFSKRPVLTRFPYRNHLPRTVRQLESLGENPRQDETSRGV